MRRPKGARPKFIRVASSLNIASLEFWKLQVVTSATSARVSVILATYNRGDRLSRAVESVLRQTFDLLELIIVDDGSTDNTQSYLATITDPRVRILIHEVNKGCGAARNTGISAAKAPLIAFQDSDDEWGVTMLERQMKRRAEMGDDYGASYCAKFVHGRDDNGNAGPRYAAYVPIVTAKVVEGDILNTVLRQALVSTQTLIVRKDILEKVGKFDESLRIGLDWELSIRLARITKFAFVQEPLVMTYLQTDSISHRRLSGAYTTKVIMEKNNDLMVADPGLRADKYFQIARYFQRAGQYRSAWEPLFGAVRARPFSPKIWAAMVLGLARGPLRSDKIGDGEAKV